MPSKRAGTPSMASLPPRCETPGGRSACTDRSALPKASICYTRDGTPTYGLPERPLVRALRHEFEDQKSVQNLESLERQHSRPNGARHEAYYNYMESLEKAKQAAELEEARRAERTRRACQLYRTSLDNPLMNGEGFEQDDEDDTFSMSNRTSADNPLHARQRREWGAQITRPASAPLTGRKMHQTSKENPFYSGGSDNGSPQRPSTPSGRRTPNLQTSPENPLMGSRNGYTPPRPPSAANSMRHSARLQFEARHTRVGEMEEAQRNAVDADRQAAYTHYREAGQLEKDLLKQYPHGVPRHVRMKLEQQGIILPPIGYGLSAGGTKGVITRG